MTRARGKMWKRVGTARRFAWAGTDARHPVAGERRIKGNGGAARSAAVGKSRGKPPQTSPTGSIVSAALQNPAESRLGRAHRQASSRRPCKTPWEAASDEPIGKHRLGVRTRHPMAGGWQRKKYGRAAGERRIKGNGGAARSAAVGKSRGKPPRTSPSGSTASAALEKPAGEARLRRAPQRPWKSPQKAASDEPIGKHRLGGPAKPRRKPPWTSPSASIVSAALQKPAEGRLGRALREAPPRRAHAASDGGRQGKGRSMTRARGKMWEREGAARRFAWAGTGARHPFPGRRGAEKEVQCRARRR